MALGNDSTLGLVSNLNDALDPIDVNEKDSSAEKLVMHVIMHQ
jgi:hypothetical protein